MWQITKLKKIKCLSEHEKRRSVERFVLVPPGNRQESSTDRTKWAVDKGERIKKKRNQSSCTHVRPSVCRDPQVPPQPSFLDHSAHPPEAHPLEPPPALWDYAFPLHAMAIWRARLLHLIGDVSYTPLRTLDVRDFLKVWNRGENSEWSIYLKGLDSQRKVRMLNLISDSF